jgi:hypothetical protein
MKGVGLIKCKGREGMLGFGIFHWENGNWTAGRGLGPVIIPQLHDTGHEHMPLRNNVLS